MGDPSESHVTASISSICSGPRNSLNQIWSTYISRDRLASMCYTRQRQLACRLQNQVHFDLGGKWD